MILEQLVPSLDLCQQLKAAGFPQDTAMVRIKTAWGLHVVENGDPVNRSFILCAAPTAGELEEWLYVRGFSLETWYGTDSQYHIEQRGYVFRGDRPLTVKDARHVSALAALVLEVAG